MTVTLSPGRLVLHMFSRHTWFDTRSPRGMIRGLVISLVGLVAGHRGIGNGTVGLIKFMKTLFSNAN